MLRNTPATKAGPACIHAIACKEFSMTARFNRLLLTAAVPLALAACASPEPAAAHQMAAVPLGTDLGGLGPVASAPQPLAPRQAAPAGANGMHHPPSGAMQMAHEGGSDAHATGTINSVDPAQHKINVSHQPIPAIGWPAMTMDFAVAPSVDLRALKPGARINFTIEKGPDGMYQIQAITPAGG
jgi:Cu/Ag efflux protein CusF